MIHNVFALVIYAFVQLSIAITGVGLKKFGKYKYFTFISVVLGILSAGFVILLLSNLTSEFVGIYQRIIEILILIWIFSCALDIKKSR